MTTLEIQRRLSALGHNPGPLDGVRGRLTIGAIKALQVKHGLKVDGIVGLRTSAVLLGKDPHSSPVRERFPDPSAPRTRSPGRGKAGPSGEGDLAPAAAQLRPWHAEALRLKGTTELAGAADNPLILSWAQRLGLGYGHDSIAWCGLFAAHCIAASLPDEPLPTNPLGARNWLRFGCDTDLALGAVLVFWRGSKAGWSGHVGFYAGEDATAFHVLGGNQSDAVTVTRIARTRLLGARWPSTAPLPDKAPVQRSADRSLSTNEA
ncbi:MAG: TIGR02594 family protein [Pseudomonadota bacterium]|nr:TIGR02594 family protein [Pseudomonadota bacterium]